MPSSRTLRFCLLLSLGFPASSLAGPLLTVLQERSDIPGYPPEFSIDGAALLTADGRHLYFSSPNGGSDGESWQIFTMGRDTTTGALTFLQEIVSNEGGVPALGWQANMALSPDETYLYVPADPGNRLAVFARDTATGLLTFVVDYADGVAGMDGLGGVTAVVISADGEHLYAAAVAEKSIAHFARDVVTGVLTLVDKVTEGVAGVVGLVGASSLVLSPDEGHVYAAGSSSDSVAAFSRDPITGSLAFVEAEFDEVGGVDGLYDAGFLAVSPDGAQVYVLSVDFRGGLVAFARDPVTGALTFIEHVESSGLIGNGRGLLVSPDGQDVYVAGSSILRFARDPVTGEVEHGETLSSSPGQRPDWLVMAPGGDQLLSGRYLNVFGIAVFDRDASTGALDAVDWVPGRIPAQVGVVSPDGRHVYYAADDSMGLLSWLDRDTATGELAFRNALFDDVAGVDGLARPTAIVMSADGANLYVTSPVDGAVSVYSRDPVTGDLAFVQVAREGVAGVTGLADAVALALDPSEAHLYVVSKSTNSIAVFARDPATGELSQVETVDDGSVPPPFTGGPSSLALSIDGRNLYVATDGDAVSVFDRDPLTGRLVLVERFEERVGPVIGLDVVRDLLVSPDDAHVYAGISGGPGSNLAYLFERDVTTGRLTPRGLLADPAAPADGSPVGLAAVRATADGLALYGGGFRSLIELQRSPATGDLRYRHRVPVGPTGIPAFGPGDQHLYLGGPTVVGFENLCAATPRTGCRRAERTLLLVKDRNKDAADRITFRWIDGDATPIAAIGDPVLGDTSYALCMYDEPGGVLTSRLDAHLTTNRSCTERDCWKWTGPESAPKGIAYAKRLGAPDAVSSLKFKLGADGDASLRATARGVRLGPPGLPLAPPVTLQVVNREGECWEAVYAGIDVRENAGVSGSGTFQGVTRDP